jgi:hypothetical protein
MFVEAGIERIREKSLKITDYLMSLIAEIASLGYSIGNPREASRRGGHVAVIHPEAARICKCLKKRRHSGLPNARRRPPRSDPALQHVPRNLADRSTSTRNCRTPRIRNRSTWTRLDRVSLAPRAIRLLQLESTQLGRSDARVWVAVLWFGWHVHPFGWTWARHNSRTNSATILWFAIAHMFAQRAGHATQNRSASQTTSAAHQFRGE